jgi:hypothetical protein
MGYYVTLGGNGLYELRQERFRGKDHPHDLCAVARSVEEMREMVAMHFTGPVDWSAVEEVP